MINQLILEFQIWCGPKNCISHQNITESLEVCSLKQSCVVETEHNCFVPPCLPWGQCKDIDKVNDPLPHSINTNCVPNAAELGNNCAKITLIFELKKMPVVSFLINKIVFLTLLSKRLSKATLYRLLIMNQH